MIGPEQEQAHEGGAGFEDAVLIELADPEHDVFGLFRLARMPGNSATTSLAVLFAGGQLLAQRAETVAGEPPGSWERAEADGVRLETAVPLERWSAAYSSGDTKLELEARATSAPIDFAEPPADALARESGISRYEQLCEIRGELSAAGARRSLAGVGRRVHAWGPTLPPKGLRRSLYAVSSEEALTVVTVRPPGRESHGDEVVEARLTAGETDPGPFEHARVSTVYDGGGNIRKAGLELYMPGDEYPRRASGEAVAATTVEADGLRVALSFLRWSVEGSPGHGSYKMVTAA